MRGPLRAWMDFWFRPQPTSSLALVRIAFGLLAFAWTVALTPDLSAFFTADGLLPAQIHGGGVWGVLGVVPSGWAVVGVYAALLVASLAVAAGWHTRLAAAVVFVGLMSLERRNPWVFNGGDGLLRIVAFYLMLAPAGASLSLDRRRRHADRFWEFPARAPWALRLMQIQLSVVYLGGVWDKVQGSAWNNGTAVSYALRVSDLTGLPVPAFLSHSPVVVNLLTYGTLATELALGILIWNRRLRPWLIGLGVAFHLSIGWSIRVGFFGLTIFALYLSFADPDWAARRILAVRDAIARRRRRGGSGAPARGRTKPAAPEPGAEPAVLPRAT
ncbi:MAG: HTTM domain-containing protein, partial [Solirubrobacteraceae bacterium]